MRWLNLAILLKLLVISIISVKTNFIKGVAAYIYHRTWCLSTKPALSDVREVLTVTSAYAVNDIIYAAAETVTGQKKYAVTIDKNKKIHTELLSDIGFERSIIIIQPLN